jgi:hypothetical protein
MAKPRPRNLEPCTEQLKARAAGIAARFEARETARDRRLGVHRERVAVNREGLAPGWSDADYLPMRVQRLLKSSARRMQRSGQISTYTTALNNIPVAVLPSGRIVIADGGKPA